MPKAPRDLDLVNLSSRTGPDLIRRRAICQFRGPLIALVALAQATDIREVSSNQQS
jgi:hypothetical protein